MPFSNVPPLIGEALAAQGYSAPTPVQAAVLEAEAHDRDLIVSAQTGSGKTVAFGLTMAPQLFDEHGRLPFTREPLALVIAPTRELALQVSRELEWLYAKAGARIATCVGGMDASRERRLLNQGAHIVVGTPGRLRDHLERGALTISNLKVVVLDEADEMLEIGFIDDVKKILSFTPDERQTMHFSATWIASSRVGVSTRPWGSARRRSRRSSIGIANAAVFPVPVWAWPIRSRPPSSAGIARDWIGVGAS